MNTRRASVTVLMSGGLDSAILLTRLVAAPSRVLPLYVRCGLRWEAAELFWLRWFLKAMSSPDMRPLRVVDLPLHALYGAHWSLRDRAVPGVNSRDAAVYLPGRNVLLATTAAIVCAQERIETLALGVLRGNPFGDASPRFFRQMERCLAQALSVPLRILTPLRRVRKSQLIRSARHLPLHLTFSCLNPHGRSHCGRCNKCAERQRGFREAHMSDPTTYVA